MQGRETRRNKEPDPRLRGDDESIGVFRWLAPEIERELEQERGYRQQHERRQEDARAVGFKQTDAVAETDAGIRRVVGAQVERRCFEQQPERKALNKRYRRCR